MVLTDAAKDRIDDWLQRIALDPERHLFPGWHYLAERQPGAGSAAVKIFMPADMTRSGLEETLLIPPSYFRRYSDDGNSKRPATTNPALAAARRRPSL